jgi:hypothetical protein
VSRWREGAVEEVARGEDMRTPRGASAWKERRDPAGLARGEAVVFQMEESSGRGACRREGYGWVVGHEGGHR